METDSGATGYDVFIDTDIIKPLVQIGLNEPDLWMSAPLLEKDTFVDRNSAVFLAGFGRMDCSIGLPCEGDFDGDNNIDGSELALFAKYFGLIIGPIKIHTM